MNRELIMSALFDKLSAAYPFRTVGRRVLLWSKVTNQPALFLRNVRDEYEHRSIILQQVTLHAEVWIYSKAGQNPTEAPGSALNDLIDAVEAVMVPDSQYGTLTLGGLVQHCWIEGEIEYDPGDLDGQAKAIIPVQILVP